jgi:hypothetical protein
LPGREPPSRGALVIAGIGATALAAGAIFVFYRGRDQVLRDELDAGVIVDEAPRDAAAPPDDASTPVIAPADATTSADGRTGIDAGTPSHADAGARRADAATTLAARPDAGGAIDAGTRATATLTVGADPWGEIYVDGAPMGRTPRELVVPAGRHTVEIVFPAETPPRKQTFAVDLAAGETKPLQADFRN